MKQYANINKVGMVLSPSEPYFLIYLTDNIMGMSSSRIVDWRARTREQTKVLYDLRFKFKVVVMRHPGSLSNVIVVWRVPTNENESSPCFHGCMIESARNLPSMLLRHDTKDAIESISFACNTNKCHSKALLWSILPKQISPSFCGGVAKENSVLEEAVQIILSTDNKDDLNLLADM